MFSRAALEPSQIALERRIEHSTPNKAMKTKQDKKNLGRYLRLKKPLNNKELVLTINIDPHYSIEREIVAKIKKKLAEQ